VVVDYAAAFAADVTVRTHIQYALAQTLHGVESSWVAIEDIFVATHMTSTVRVEFEIVVPAGYTCLAQSTVETANYTRTIVQTLVVEHMHFVVK
jgi:Holliday junction resolvasome RuvABC endonuclease subunit